MKNIIFSLLLISVSLTICAQNNLQYGIEGGVNFTKLHAGSFIENDTKTGYFLGIIAEFSLNKKFSIQPKVLYATQRIHAKILMLCGTPKDEKYILDYLQIPIIGMFNALPNLSIEVGPSFNFLVNVSDKEKNLVNPFELSGIFGFSYQLTNRLFSSLRYTQGFSNVFDQEYSFNSSKISGFQLSMRYML